jgi:hypothetical protein
MKTKLLIAFLLGIQAYTAIMLTQARHEIRTLKDDVTLHDEMLETVGDAVTVLEGK